MVAHNTPWRRGTTRPFSTPAKCNISVTREWLCGTVQRHGLSRTLPGQAGGELLRECLRDSGPISTPGCTTTTLSDPTSATETRVAGPPSACLLAKRVKRTLTTEYTLPDRRAAARGLLFLLSSPRPANMSTDLRARLRTLQEAQARQERELDAATKAGDFNQRQKVLDEGRQELHQNQEVIEHMVLGEPRAETLGGRTGSRSTGRPGLRAMTQQPRLHALPGRNAPTSTLACLIGNGFRRVTMRNRQSRPPPGRQISS